MLKNYTKIFLFATFGLVIVYVLVGLMASAPEDTPQKPAQVQAQAGIRPSVPERGPRPSPGP